MNVLVLGYGQMGRRIAQAMDFFGHNIVAADCKCPDNLEYDFIDTESKNWQKQILDTKPDICISALPYHANEQYARFCIDNQIDYIDLGGSVEVSQAIHQYKRDNDRLKKPKGGRVFTDLGLAPGFVNILAQSYIDRGCDTIEMAVGGLPKYPHPQDVLKYTPTWSVEGLLNEYTEWCRIIKDGEIKFVDAMSVLNSYDLIQSDDVNGRHIVPAEKFYTSGGTGHIESVLKQGVKNYSYKTIRYGGHANAISQILRGEPTVEQLSSIFNQYDKDVVFIELSGAFDNGRYPGPNLSISITSQDDSTAMADATALPCAAVAHLMLTDDFPIGVLDYSCINYEKFDEVTHQLFQKYKTMIDLVGFDYRCSSKSCSGGCG